MLHVEVKQASQSAIMVTMQKQGKYKNNKNNIVCVVKYQRLVIGCACTECFLRGSVCLHYVMQTEAKWGAL